MTEPLKTSIDKEEAAPVAAESSPTSNATKGKVGPPPGSSNAIRHGLLSGNLPKGCSYIERRMNSMRRHLEETVLNLRGEVTFLEAASIQTALRWERHSALAQRWLRLECDDLKPIDRLHFSREIARASTERDKALATLKLETKFEPWIDALPMTNGATDD